jgi:hypothetical protein
MKALAFFGRAIPVAALTLLSAGATAQPLPRTSLNKASSGHAFTLGTAHVKRPNVPDGGCAPNGLCLVVTLAPAQSANPALCGTQTDLAVNIGDQVNICYTVTNHSTTTLNYQTLADDHVGNLLTNQNVAIAAGASYQYNRTITASTNPGSDTGTFVSTWTSTDVIGGYAANNAAAYAFVDISATGTGITLSDDGAQSVTLPFAFPFYGGSSNTLCIGNNGELRFGVASCSSSPYSNAALPAANLNGPALLPYWDDMLPNGTVYYASIGSAPNRQFIVEYKNKFSYGDSGDPTGQTGATFEVILNEADGSIAFQYQTTSFGGAGTNYNNGVSATVGLQSNSAFANQYSYNTASLHDGLAIGWTSVNPISYTASAAATLDVGSPSMITTPDAAAGFTPTVSSGSSISAPLSIDNIGNRDLVWSLTPPPANAHFPKTPRNIAPSHSPWDGRPGISPYSLRTPSKAKSPVPFGTNAVPVYATKVKANGSDYVSFDAADPAVFNTILLDSVSLFGITFVDNDFSKEYGVDYNEGDLYSISTLDGTATLIGNTGLVSCCYVVPGGMRWDSTTGTTYLVIGDFHPEVRSSKLYTIDLATGATTLVGPLAGAIRDITIDNSGLMYGIDSDADTLVAIDKTTAQTQTIGSIGFDAIFGQGLDFDAETGVLYLASADENSSTMYTVDPATGATTLVGTMGGELDSMAIAKSGVVCSTTADTPWLTYDVTNGTVTPDPDHTHPATVNVSFDATSLAPGNYSANVCVYSNDLSHSRVAIPVSLTVGEGGPTDVIFQNGFDGAGGTTVSISQTSDSTPIAGNSVACGDSSAGTTADNQYWRRYVFSEYSLSSPVSIASVDVAVEQTSGAPNVTVTLYTIPHSVAVDTIDTAQLTQIGTASAVAPADATLTTFNVPVQGSVADTAANDLVVEVSTEDSGDAFYIGTTTAAETHPSFLSSTACGITDPTTVGDIGYPNAHAIEAVNIVD